MATKKNDNNILLIAALAVGGYFFWKKSQPAADSTATGTLPVSTTQPVLSIPASSLTSTSAPVNAVSNAPNTNAVNTSALVPATINQQGNVVLQPGQTLAVSANGSPIIGAGGIPLVFNGSSAYSAIMGVDEGECL